MLATLAQVALGGAVGATLRYLTGVFATRTFGADFPFGTMIVNVLGSFLMGVLIVTLAERGGMRFAPLLAVGFLGGFTTFSSFSLDLVSLVERGEMGAAAVYLLGSVILSIGALFAGLSLMRAVLA